ncbi:MAG TPA: penicillin-binding transpeptidase domain-containing protein, partial [Candidatus Paceibacterota bacterium]|nr:penicillin-binding transpeptidase domain-containing protein [Candidatus Paceibacterota bacterium]
MAKDYYVSIDDDLISPEETLLDSGSEFSDLERPVSPFLFRFAFWGVGLLLMVIFLASARLGLADFDHFSALALQNRSGNYSVPAPRGIIYDSDGTPLVKNSSSFDLMAVSKELRPALAGKDPAIASVAKALGQDPEQFEATLSDEASAQGIFSVADDITKEQVLSIQSGKSPGLYIIPDVKRSYVDGPVFSQVVGYVGKINQDELNKDDYYTINDVTGRLGLEQQYEQYLRGTHGHIQFGQDSGIDTGARAGDNLVLNMDSGLQREVYTTLKNILSSAGLTAGAAVVQDPSTGAVLSLVSFPGYDNNEFVHPLSQAQYNAIFNSSGRPLFNRVISGLYNPGSTIKPMMGMMGLQEGVITPDTTIQDCISITIPNPSHPGEAYTFHNWRVDKGPFNLRRSIANSCNVFFATLGGGFGDIAGLGVSRIVSYLTKTLADSILGIDLPGEQHGFVPTADWKKS